MNIRMRRSLCFDSALERDKSVGWLRNVLACQSLVQQLNLARCLCGGSQRLQNISGSSATHRSFLPRWRLRGTFTFNGAGNEFRWISQPCVSSWRLTPEARRVAGEVAKGTRQLRRFVGTAMNVNGCRMLSVATPENTPGGFYENQENICFIVDYLRSCDLDARGPGGCAKSAWNRCCNDIQRE